ncbi:MAG: RsmE family RNA methyltransferase [Syntrophobacteraceae bacterium]
MTRRCFFVPEVASDTRIFDLPPRLSRQLHGVLRARVGESIELLDGQGSAWACVITGIRRGTVSVSLTGKLDRPTCESPLAIVLGIGIARSDTMDLVVRQAAEMGVLRLAFFQSVRSQYGLRGKTAEKKKERWSKIASEAACQCGRTKRLEIEIFEDLGHFLTSFEGEEEPAEHTLKIFALEREPGSGLRNLRGEAGPDISRVLAVLGPEGGWDKVETSALIGAGFKPVSLGPRTLRLETAAVALISFIQILWGDLEEGLFYGSREEVP